MNQIPNIEKTMRRGIKLIAGRIEALHPQYFLDETTYKHDVKGTMDVVKGVMADIEETLHHQLQKAREEALTREKQLKQVHMMELDTISCMSLEQYVAWRDQRKQRPNHPELDQDVSK